jgi:SET domain-containing protein
MISRKKSYSWMNPKLIVKDTKKYGKGVFAIKKIRKDELLSIFGGYVMSRSEEMKLPKKVNDNAVQISEGYVLGVKKVSELEDASYFNHSCNPNAGFKGQIFLVAMRNIRKGEQITFDYGMVLHEIKNLDKQYKLKCYCGSKKCRRFITFNDWKKPELQKKYFGYFQLYLQEKLINAA